MELGPAEDDEMDYSEGDDDGESDDFNEQYSSDDGGEDWADDASFDDQDVGDAGPLDIDLNEEDDLDEEEPPTLVPIPTPGKRKRQQTDAPPTEKGIRKEKKAKKQKMLAKLDDTSLEDLALRLLGN